MVSANSVAAHLFPRLAAVSAWYFHVREEYFAFMKKFPSSLCWCSAVVLLATFAGCENKTAPLPPQAPPPQSSPSPTKIVSAEPTSYDAIARHLDAGGGLYFYLSTEGFVKAV